MKRKGIILAGGTGSRLYPMTMAVSKQLMPIYDKPMIYYPLSVLMLAGIRDILVISTSNDLPLFRRLLGTGTQFGVKFSYARQTRPKGLAHAFIIGRKFIGSDSSALALGDNLFYGHDFVKAIQTASAHTHGATIFGYHVANPFHYGVVELNAEGRAISIEEKPVQPKSNYAIPGLYFYDNNVVNFARQLKPSKRGELEISDLNRIYLRQNRLRVQLLGRGTAWLDTGTHDSLLDAAQFVQVVEKRQGLKICCPEEIAYRKGWITLTDVKALSAKFNGSAYGEYLRKLIYATGDQPSVKIR